MMSQVSQAIGIFALGIGVGCALATLRVGYVVAKTKDIS